MLKISDLFVGRKDEGETSSFHVQFHVAQPLRRRVGGGLMGSAGSSEERWPILSPANVRTEAAVSRGSQAYQRREMGGGSGFDIDPSDDLRHQPPRMAVVVTCK